MTTAPGNGDAEDAPKRRARRSRRSGVATRALVTKAVILAGGDSAALFPLTEASPKPLLPVLNRPFVDWQIEALVRSGVNDIIVTLSPDTEGAVSNYLEGLDRPGVSVQWTTDSIPRGPAGSLKPLATRFEGESLFVLDCSTFIANTELEALALAHFDRGAALTFGVLDSPKGTGPPEAVFSAAGNIREIIINYHSVDATEKRLLSGICVLDSSALALVPEDAFFDIKEGLFEALQRDRQKIAAESIQGLCLPVDDLPKYLQLQTLALEADLLNESPYRQIADRTWVGEETRIQPTAYVLGPVVIGDRCEIEDGAHVIGPAVIADDCRVGAHGVVRASHLWDGVELTASCRVENSIVTSGARLENHRRLEHIALMPASESERERAVPLAGQPPVVLLQQFGRRSRLSRLAKNVVDFLGAAILLLLLSPLFPLCSLAILIDSGRPILFRQLRCGRGGRFFRMLKFRTMVPDAAQRRHELEATNESDGPVFKMEDDPRITKVGAFLRRTSLDELPQLFNVIRGDMSLVGPRPLEEDEMRFCPAWRDRRLSVKPGLTGLWQVSGRSKARFHDWVRYDIEYTKSQSLWLDFKILLKTLVVVFRRSGAY